MSRSLRFGLALTLVALSGCAHAPVMPEAAPASAVQAAAADWPTFLAKTLRTADLDHSGGLSLKESGLTRSEFEGLDTNHDGQLTAAELFATVSATTLQKRLATFQPLVEATFGALDTNHDGRLSSIEARRFGDWAPHGLLGAEKGLSRADFQALYPTFGQPLTLGETGFSNSLGEGILGPYLWVTAHLAAAKALHPPRDHVKTTPAAYGFPYENISLKASDGTPLAGWYVPAARPSTKTIVLIHGYQCNRVLWFDQKVVPMLQDTYNLVMIDLRNHGESGGNTTTFSTLERLDVEAAIDYAQGRGATSIGVIGQSLGASSSINAVAERPQVKALVEDCGFATVQSAFTGAIASTWIPQPALVAAAAIQIANQELGFDMTAHEPIVNLAKIAPRPLLVIHGGDDPYISPDNAQIIFSAYPGPKSMWICPGAHHGDSDTTDPTGWRTRVRALFDSTL